MRDNRWGREWGKRNEKRVVWERWGKGDSGDRVGGGGGQCVMHAILYDILQKGVGRGVEGEDGR